MRRTTSKAAPAAVRATSAGSRDAVARRRHLVDRLGGGPPAAQREPDLAGQHDGVAVARHQQPAADQLLGRARRLLGRDRASRGTGRALAAVGVDVAQHRGRGGAQLGEQRGHPVGRGRLGARGPQAAHQAGHARASRRRHRSARGCLRAPPRRGPGRAVAPPLHPHGRGPRGRSRQVPPKWFDLQPAGHQARKAPDGPGRRGHGGSTNAWQPARRAATNLEGRVWRDLDGPAGAPRVARPASSAAGRQGFVRVSPAHDWTSLLRYRPGRRRRPARRGEGAHEER